MKYLSLFPICVLSAVALSNASPLPDKASAMQRNSYTLGLAVADVLQQNKRAVDVDYLSRGVRDGLGQGEVAISSSMRQSMYDAFIGVKPAVSSNDMQAREVSLFNFNKKKNNSPKVEKKKVSNQAPEQEVVKVPAPAETEEKWEKTDSGLEFRVIKHGADLAEKPLAKDYVTVNYEGKLDDGTVFDSSYKRGQAIEFRLDDVIKGWTEGLQLMEVGSTFELRIPSELGYGKNGMPPIIPGDSRLTFKVELLGINE